MRWCIYPYSQQMITDILKDRLNNQYCNRNSKMMFYSLTFQSRQVRLLQITKIQDIKINKW